MKLFAASALLLASAPVALGQDFTLLNELFQALNSSGHTQLVSAAQKLNGTGSGQSILAQLSDRSPSVLFAPTDSAFNLTSSVSSDVDVLADVIAYHIVSGNFTGVSTTYPNTTVGFTLLSDPKVVQLEASGLHQVVAWATRSDGKIHVLNQVNDTTVTNTTTFGNITINSIDHVLNFPQPLSTTVVTDNTSLTIISTVLHNVSFPFFNASTNQTASTPLFNILESGLHGFTFFAPNNTAITQALSSLTSLESDQTAVEALFQNHIINGTTVYSPLLAGSNANRTSAAGEPLSFVLNATGHYVTSGNVTAQIIQPDVLLPNGVIHVIDRVLVNTESNAAAASSA
ncbi:FAS1 domain-containing protein [Dichomitus squalens]|nr:FAS1 domain-containing protein [Dichomitus squalens]